MAQQSVPLGTWDEDPDGASILLATGRARHDLLVIAEPAFLRDLDQVWGRPSARVRLSFLPGVHAPSAPGQEDALMSYERGGLGPQHDGAGPDRQWCPPACRPARHPCHPAARLR